MTTRKPKAKPVEQPVEQPVEDPKCYAQGCKRDPELAGLCNYHWTTRPDLRKRVGF